MLSIEEIKLQRQNQNVEPLKEERSNEILNMKNSKDNIIKNSILLFVVIIIIFLFLLSKILTGIFLIIITLYLTQRFEN